MYRLIISFASLLLATSIKAQSPEIVKIAMGCDQHQMRNDLYYLASDKLNGRLIGTRGDTLTSEFVAASFKKAGLKAPYDGGYMQSIIAHEKIVSSTLTFAGKTFNKLEGWMLYPRIPVTMSETPIIFGFRSIDEVSEFIRTQDVKGKVLMVTGNVFREILRNNTVDSIEAAWKHAGVGAIGFYGHNVQAAIDRTKKFILPPEFENKDLEKEEGVKTADDPSLLFEIGFTIPTINALLAADNIVVNADETLSKELSQPIELKTRISVKYHLDRKEIRAPNVIGILPGLDTSLSVIVVSAHHDHQGRVDGVLYPGAVDNASGTVAIMEMAAMLQRAAKLGHRPKRTIVFASFTGEEKGMLGSFHYVKNPVHPMERTHAVLNMDMLGRVDTFYSGKRADSTYAYTLVMDSARGLRSSLMEASKYLPGLKLDWYYERPENVQRRLLGSDQYPFYARGVPFIRIDCGFSADYHLPSDTPDKINYPLLTEQTKLAFLTLWNMANN